MPITGRMLCRGHRRRHRPPPSRRPPAKPNSPSPPWSATLASSAAWPRSGTQPRSQQQRSHWRARCGASAPGWETCRQGTCLSRRYNARWLLLTISEKRAFFSIRTRTWSHWVRGALMLMTTSVRPGGSSNGRNMVALRSDGGHRVTLCRLQAAEQRRRRAVGGAESRFQREPGDPRRGHGADAPPSRRTRRCRSGPPPEPRDQRSLKGFTMPDQRRLGG